MTKMMFYRIKIYQNVFELKVFETQCQICLFKAYIKEKWRGKYYANFNDEQNGIYTFIYI